MEDKAVKEQMCEVLLKSSRQFLDLAQTRINEKDYIEAISILNETLGYLNPNSY